MTVNTPLYIAIFVIAVAFFVWSGFQRFRLVTLGTPENRFRQVAKRTWIMLFHPLTQRCTISRRYLFGINHAIFFWGFFVLVAVNVEFALSGLSQGYISFSRLPDSAYYTLALIFELVWVIALVCIFAALLRRAAFRPKHVDPISIDASITMSLVALLLVSFFGLHASQIALGLERAAAHMPVSNFLSANLMSGSSTGSLGVTASVFWWIYAVAQLGFLNYLVRTKHMHPLTAIPNCFFKSLEKVTTQPREEFKKGNTFGAGQVDQFRWKDLFDAFSCTDCGRCSDVCPATFVEKTLDPRLIVRDIKYNLLKNGPHIFKKEKPVVPLIGDDVKEGKGTAAAESLWACTTCGACMEVCPPFIEHVPKIVAMRRNLVEMKSEFPAELLTFFENMEQRSNPWGIAPSDRAKWAAEIATRPFEAGKTEYLFYVGCAGAFDARERQVTLAVARILDAAGISWGILGREEQCCGDSLRRLGNEFVFDRMARENIKMYREKGIKKIITLCPHCYSTLKHDYRQYDMELDVIHHTELINTLIQGGQLKLNGKADVGKVVFHDACYLGRYNEIYEPPRQAVAAVTGQAPAEMKRNRNLSFCCGGGGGRMWMEEDVGKRLHLARTQEALKENPQTICVSCPYCMTMFEDGLKDEKVEDKVKVLDLAEIVARALK